MILELCEENERSFFHAAPCTFERFKIGLLRWGYPLNRPKVTSRYICSGLLKQLLSHPNIVIDRERKKNDHSKFYVIDEHILIFGGINVEDKECGMDCAGRVYQDYMLKLEGKDHVLAFLHKLEENRDTSDAYCFRMNNKTIHPPVFEMYKSFLSIINGAQKELVIVMAYFAPIKPIIRAIVSAWQRGVRIRILIPERANFMNGSNKKVMYLLMKSCRNEIELRFSPKMIHTKLIFSEHSVTFGSCNITNRAFFQLDEVDIELKNEDTPLINHIKESVDENWSLSQLVDDYRQIRYSPMIAWIESRLN
jgi:cardiolipin synthase